MREKTTILFLFLSIFFGFNSLSSQSFNDFSNVNFSELSDGEIDLLLRRATAQGYTQFDLLKMARAQGFTQADIENLDKRFKSAQLHWLPDHWQEKIFREIRSLDTRSE